MPAYAPPPGALLSLANTWAAKQTFGPITNGNAIAASNSLTGANAQSVLDMAVTWNTSGTPTAIKVNVTDTASNASSLLMDLQVGGTSLFNVNKAGGVTIGGGVFGASGAMWASAASGLNLLATAPLLFNSDTILRRDAANTVAQRNGTNAQTKRVYGTFTDGSNYRRVALAMSTAGVATLLPEGAGTGASGNVLHISGLPTSNPGPGILWNDTGTVKVGT